MVALSPVSPSLAPATNYDRINAAIAEAAKVSSKQDAFDLPGLLTSVSQKALQTDLAALTTAVNGKASAAALTALQNTVGGKASQTALDSLTTAVAGKANASDLAALTSTVGTKASTTSVAALTATVGTKASQLSVDSLTTSVASLSQAVTGKAAQSDLISLTQLVNGKATQSALDGLSVTVAGKVGAAAFNALSAVVDTKAGIGDLADLRDAVARINAGLYPAERPGDNPTAFSSSRAGGDSAALAPLDTALYPVRAVGDGLGVEVTASREVWQRRLHAVETGRLWCVRWRYVRTVNAQDPENDSVQALIQWYDRTRAALGSPVQVEAFTPAVNGGPHERIDFVGIGGGGAVTLPRPNGGVYFRIGLKAFGNEARTVLTDLQATDVSDIDDAILRLVPEDSSPALSARIDALVGDLADEATTREEADSALSQAISAEIARATAADAANASRIGQEEVRAKAAEKVVADGLASEVTRAQAAEKAVADGLAATDLRTSEISLDTGSERYPFAFVDSLRRLGFGITKAGLVATRGFEVAKPDSKGRVMVLRDMLGRAASWVEKDGSTFISKMRLGRMPRRYGDGMAWAIVDVRGRIGLGLTRFGYLRTTLEDRSLTRSERLANRPPVVAVAAGAPGTVTEVRRLDRPRNVIRYRSDASGASLPYRALLNAVPGSAHILDTGSLRSALLSSVADVDIGDGQSWEVGIDLPPGLVVNDGVPGSGVSFGQIINGRMVPNTLQGTGTNNNNIKGLANLVGTKEMGVIARQAAVAVGLLRQGAGIHVSPLVVIGGPAGGATWEQLKPGSEYWAAHAAQFDIVRQRLADYGLTPRFRSVGWTHQAGNSGSSLPYYDVLAAMVAAHDGLNLNSDGSLLHFFTDQTAPTAQQTQAQDAILDQDRFARDNAARVHCIGPRYPYPFADDIHHNALGYVLIGELRGYAQHVVFDLGLPWDHFRPTAITVTGNTFKITTTRPYGMGDVTIDTTSIESAGSGRGIAIRIGGTARNVSNVAASGDDITGNFDGAAASTGTAVEVSGNFYGSGAPFGTHSGVWGNIKRAGPPSTRIEGRTIDVWLSVFKQQVNAS